MMINPTPGTEFIPLSQFSLRLSSQILSCCFSWWLVLSAAPTRFVSQFSACFLLVYVECFLCVLLLDLWCYETMKIVTSKLSLIADGNFVAGDSNMGTGTWSASF